MPPARVALITGAAGFLGRHVARRLARDGTVVAGLGHGDFGDDEPGDWGIAHWYDADVTLEALCRLKQQPDIVVHCAGGSLVARSIAAPLEDFDRTVRSTAAVLEYMRTRSPQARMIYPSSAAVYGQVSSVPIRVDAIPRPISPYGAHKLVGEELCRAHARQNGTSVAILRFFSIYGPGLRKQLLWDAAQRLTAGSGLFQGSGLEVRDWLHVADAAELVATAAAVSSPSCPVANGGTGLGVSVRQIVSELARTLAPHIDITFAGIARAGDPLAYVADVSDASAWGWSPSISWQKGVEDYARWHLDRMRT